MVGHVSEKGNLHQSSRRPDIDHNIITTQFLRPLFSAARCWDKLQK